MLALVLVLAPAPALALRLVDWELGRCRCAIAERTGLDTSKFALGGNHPAHGPLFTEVLCPAQANLSSSGCRPRAGAVHRLKAGS